MANAAADKLKEFGIRHSEKVVVGLTATLFVVFTAMAVIRPTLDMKPDELSKAAGDAQSNLSRPQDVKDILAKLEKDGLKEPNFQKIVESQFANALKPGDYRSKLDWVTPEPGAGLIRDQPELIAPTELAAFPGRGGILMYALDDKGERQIETPEEVKKKPHSKRKRRTMGGMMGGSSGGGRMAMPGSGGYQRPPAEDTPEAKKRKAAEEEIRKKQFAGIGEVAKEKGKENAEPDPATGPWKEETHGKRWVVITGVIDNAKLKKNYLLALKNEAIAYPNYKRLDIERQIRQEDSTWSEWEMVESKKNWEVLDNLPEVDTEYVPETQRPPALVDALPFLRAGYWTGVHIARLVPPEVLEPPKPPPGGRGGMNMAMGGRGGSSSGMDSNMMQAMGGRGGRGGGMGSSGKGGMMMGGDVAGPGSAGGGNPEEANFTKFEDPELMLRSLDFTVDASTTYRFRVRIVVVNPNYEHEDVNPGVDNTSKNLLGPWSEPTDEVSIPADVAAYAQAPEENSRRDDIVSFQVIRWDPTSGQTLIKNDVASPGEIVGEYGSVPKPDVDAGGVKPANIDFNSRAVLLDSMGGRDKIPDIGVERNKFEVPAVALLVEPDGSVVIRTQARDNADEVRDDMEKNYKMALEDAEKSTEQGGSRAPGQPQKKKKKKRR
jgi:hypothetical protein